MCLCVVSGVKQLHHTNIQHQILFQQFYYRVNYDTLNHQKSLVQHRHSVHSILGNSCLNNVVVTDVQI